MSNSLQVIDKEIEKTICDECKAFLTSVNKAKKNTIIKYSVVWFMILSIITGIILVHFKKE